MADCLFTFGLIHGSHVHIFFYKGIYIRLSMPEGELNTVNFLVQYLNEKDAVDYIPYRL